MHQITINPAETVPVTPGMIGLFFEDINYNLDGGLHAEMIENRNFEALRVFGRWDDYHTSPDGLYGWQRRGAEISVHTERPLNEVNPHYLHVTAVRAQDGFSNKAYDGIYLEAGKEYRISFYARGDQYNGAIEITVDDMTVRVEKLEGEWKQYHAVLTAERDVERGEFRMALTEPGSVDFDLISMMPADAVCGVFRRDLVERLKALKPGFLRFPGGCIIEGNNLANRYQWKKTVGPVETRTYNWNRWAIHGVPNQFQPRPEEPFESEYCHYGQTYGVGYYEYFLLCEELKAKPLPVLSVGLACQYQSTEMVAIDSLEFQEFVQDALDLIEFANGDVDTAWGRVRAEMGHPEPFHMDLIGIGNEQWQTEKADFFERYEKFEEAIHAVYPEMRLIGSAGPDVLTPRYEAAWDWIHKRVEDNPDFVYAVDEHYYVRPQWLYEHVDFYDAYPRNAKVFAGEYAAHVEGKGGRFNSPQSNNFEAALAEAAFLTGVERNADVVVMASYAPLMARLGYAQWSPDLIWFDGKSSYGTPSYYVQMLYSRCMGDRSLKTSVEGDGLYASATYDSQQDRYIVKIVNSTAEEAAVRLKGVPGDTEIQRIEMAYDLQAVNSTAQPEAVAPITSTETMTEGVIQLKAYSFTVLVIGG